MTSKDVVQELREIADALICRGGVGHYCPNCDQSTFNLSQQVNRLVERLASPVETTDARDAARYRVVRVSRFTGEVLAHELDAACDKLIAACSAVEPSEKPLQAAIRAATSRDARSTEGAGRPGPLEKAEEPEAVRAGVSVKDPTPPQEIILCAAMGPSGFICERPKGHPGRHCDGDNQRWPSENGEAPQ